MSKTVLIVEKDVALMRAVAQSLAGRAVKVEESTDGKGSPELIRRLKPDCVVLAVDLDAGQNGYILCKKLKSDDELKTVPVIIIGDSKGFAQHQKLKTRAEDYVGKPLAVDQLVEAVGKIMGGFPPIEEPAADAFDPGSVLDGEGDSPFPVEEVQLDGNTGEHGLGSESADFEMVDSMFEDVKPAPQTESMAAAPEPLGLGATEGEVDERTVVGFMPAVNSKSPPLFSEKKPAVSTTKVHAFSPLPISSPSGIDGAESRELRSKVTELTGSLDEAQQRAADLQARVRELEAELESKETELETARTGASANTKSDKEVFALRDSVNKKDKEILRYKSELNDKEKEIVELREKENALDQQVAETSNEMARRDAQIKTLQTKSDQLTGERKRVDQQLATSKEEARAASAKLTTLQGDFEMLQSRNLELEGQFEPLRAAAAELDEMRIEVESLRSQLEERSREADDQRAQLETVQSELEGTRSQINNQAQAFADEISGLRQRVSELETESHQAEERANRSVERVKAHQEQAERVRQALQMALGHLEQPPDAEELDIDEIAEA